ncbi:hypothetical protein VNO77_15526 [Canavalia gladiata]|uniref:Uncharacterized protein n=1 Tax=Canavalia gladiata TaxID=3824 RepID=A0AAN9QSE9_CANGL
MDTGSITEAKEDWLRHAQKVDERFRIKTALSRRQSRSRSFEELLFVRASDSIDVGDGRLGPPSEAKATLPSSQAKKIGFKPKFSGETNAIDSDWMKTSPPKPREPEPNLDPEASRFECP